MKQETVEQVKQKTAERAQEETAQAINPRVKLQTNLGDMVIELNPQAAPVTVENFLRYVTEGFYDGVIFHRVIAGFMIQGGGLTVDMQEKRTNPPIINEASNGLSNDRGTIAMARFENNPNSATSQFFINVADNQNLDYTGPDNPGHSVFGKVVEGMKVVDKIAAVNTTSVGPYKDVPVEPVVILEATLILK
ncbi:MAG: hypothetical protein AMJ79_05060 [Phycisphaerae bacterium SM23_30]|nr:MAG: hypothetical protein AMJ79_05060 [Phycisphaerae bacterium SM23_30]